MKKTGLLLTFCVLFSACGEYTALQKHGDTEDKYEFAKACYVQGRYGTATEVFNELVLATRNSYYAEECLYMLAMSAYKDGDNETAAGTFRKYYQSYPQGIYVEDAHYYCGLALYESIPDPRLDQTTTQQAILELDAFLERYPYTRLKRQTEQMIERLQDHLVEKEYLQAKLYYDLGGYIMNSTHGGSNYQACIVTSENALKDYPYASSERREQFMLLILRSRFNLARLSVEERRVERFRETVDEYYNFVGEFPESKNLAEAQGYFRKSQKALKGQPLEED